MSVPLKKRMDQWIPPLVVQVTPERLCEVARIGTVETMRVMLKFFLQSGSKRIPKDEYGCTPLHHAAYFGRVEVCQELLTRAPAWIHEVDQDGRNALYYAVWQGHARLWPILLEAGLDARNANLDGANMLHFAASRGDAACVEALLCAGADPKDVEYGLMRTPLHLAASKGSLECIQALLATGVSVDSRDVHDLTPLAYSLLKKDRPCARALFKAGAAPLAVHREIPIPHWLFEEEPEVEEIAEIVVLLSPESDEEEGEEEENKEDQDEYEGPRSLRRTMKRPRERVWTGCRVCKSKGIKHPDHKSCRSRNCPWYSKERNLC